jgi:hypothetical protein
MDSWDRENKRQKRLAAALKSKTREDAMYVAKTTVDQWVKALNEGLQVGERTALLLGDLENVQTALDLISECENPGAMKGGA